MGEAKKLRGFEIGDRVVVTLPHPEAGAIGEITHLYTANEDYDGRARVKFGEPYPGREIIRLDWLAKR